MGDGVPPRREAAVGPEVVPVSGLEADQRPHFLGLPLKGRIEPTWQSLEHFATSHTQQKWLVGSRQVLVVAASKANPIVDELDVPLGVSRRPVSVLSDGLFVFLGDQKLVVVALQADRFGVAEKIHARLSRTQNPELGNGWVSDCRKDTHTR